METGKETGRSQRRWQRYDIDCRVKVTYIRDSRKQFNYGRGQDINVGGMLLVVPINFEIGQWAELEFMPPNMSEVLTLECVIRHRPGQYSYGVEFRNVTNTQQGTIYRMFDLMNAIESTR